MDKSGGKVGKSWEKLENLGKNWEKWKRWGKVTKSGESWQKWQSCQSWESGDRWENVLFLKNWDKMATGGHFGCPKITFDHSSCHFRSIRNFFFF